MSRFTLWLAWLVLLVPAFCSADVITFTPHDTAVKKGQNWILLHEYTFVQDSFAQNCPLAKKTSCKKTAEVVDTAGIIAVEQGIPDSLVPFAVAARGKPIIVGEEKITTHSDWKTAYLIQNTSVAVKKISFNAKERKVAFLPAKPIAASSEIDWIVFAIAVLILLFCLAIFASPKKNSGSKNFLFAMALVLIVIFVAAQIGIIALPPALPFLFKAILLTLFLGTLILLIVAIINKYDFPLAATAFVLQAIAIIALLTGVWQAAIYYLIAFALFFFLLAIISSLGKKTKKEKSATPPKTAAAKKEAPKKTEIKQTITKQTETQQKKPQ